MMGLKDDAISEEAFEALPPVLRRKLLDSRERLRLAGLKDAGWRRTSTSNHLTSASRKQSTTPSIGPTPRTFCVSSTSLPRSKSRLRKNSRAVANSPSALIINPWDFAALPSKIRAHIFSPEEQFHIAIGLDLIVLDAADEALYKQHQQEHQPLNDHSCDFGLAELDDVFLEEEEEEEDMEGQDLENFRWLDDDTNLDLRLDDYHAVNAEIGRQQSTISPRRRSLRHGLSFSNVPFNRRSSSSLSLQPPTPIGTNANKASSQVSPAFLQPRHQSKASTTSLDLAATHYQDPAAKMKLRVYLASPQKFDEALEFGFPSLHKDAVQSPGRPKTSPGLVDSQPKTTFFADDTPSLSEDEDKDELSDCLHQDSPRTPVDMSFPVSRPSYKSSTDRSSRSQPRIIQTTLDSYAHASASDREMTLRMTLTRPELRALEEHDHADRPLVNDTPLEKVPLTVPVCQERSIWDELPEEPSRVKRFFKKLKGRS